MERHARLRKNITRGKRIFAAAAVDTAVSMTTNTVVPFMTYADTRDLRHRLYMAYNTKCTHDNEFNNIDIV